MISLGWANKNPRLLEKALAFAKTHHYRKAIPLFKKVLEEEPKNLSALQGIGWCLYTLQHYKDSLYYFERAYPIDSKNTVTHLGLAMGYEKENILHQSLFYYKKVISFEPTHITAHLGIARIFVQNEQLNSAAKTYQSILELDPYQKDALQGLALVYRKQRKLHEALSIEKKTLEIKPKDKETLLRIAALHENEGHIEDAIFWYEKAKKVAPTDNVIYAKLSLLYNQVGKTEDAILALKQANELQGGNLKNFITLGRAYTWLARVDEAIATYEQAATLFPNDPAVLHELAKAYLLKDRWDQAEILYQKIVKLDPHHSLAKMGLKEIREKKWPIWTSRFQYKERKDKDPSNHDTKTHKLEYAQEMQMNVTPRTIWKAFYQRNHHDQDDLEAHSQNYDFTQDIVSVTYKTNLADDFIVSARANFNHFDNQGPNAYNTQKDLDRLTAFSYFLFSQKSFYIFAFFQRALLLRLKSPNVLKQDPYHENALTWGWNLTQNLESIFYYAYTNYQEIKDTHNIQTSLFYILPFWRKLQMGYQFEWLTDPLSRVQTARLRFQDTFFRTITAQLLYKFSWDHNKTDAGLTYIQNLNGRLSLPLYKSLTLHVDSTLEFEFGKDHDRKQEHLAYLEVPLGKLF
ncbi:MAG: tetratricopeptide repeat protein [Deltaproteobacteria bacterium]|nr:tetratricopeptide repeat protein [Deltaproteobacteria bacterium]